MTRVSEPITKKLAELEDWKRWVFHPSRPDGYVQYVTKDFHNAFIAELVARYELKETQQVGTE